MERKDGPQGRGYSGRFCDGMRVACNSDITKGNEDREGAEKFLFLSPPFVFALEHFKKCCSHRPVAGPIRVAFTNERRDSPPAFAEATACRAGAWLQRCNIHEIAINRCFWLVFDGQAREQNRRSARVLKTEASRS